MRLAASGMRHAPGLCCWVDGSAEVIDDVIGSRHPLYRCSAILAAGFITPAGAPTGAVLGVGC